MLPPSPQLASFPVLPVPDLNGVTALDGGLRAGAAAQEDLVAIVQVGVLAQGVCLSCVCAYAHCVRRPLLKTES